MDSTVTERAAVIMTESLAPEKKSKVELEEMVKANSGKVFQVHTAASQMICVADRSGLCIHQRFLSSLTS